MTNAGYIPKITPAFETMASDENSILYNQAIVNMLEKILPTDIFRFKERDKEFKADQEAHFQSLLPLVRHTDRPGIPGDISFYILSKYRPNAFKFFFEMVSRWLVPGKRLNVLLIYAVDFSMQELGPDLYTLCEVMLRVESKEDWEEMQRNLPIIEMEVKLGVESAFYARRILEIKGLSADEKTALVQDYIANLVKKLPAYFDIDVVTEMQHVLVMCRDDFKNKRASRHLSRIIGLHYLFRRDLQKKIKETPSNRHLQLKIFKSQLLDGSEQKSVLSIVVGLNFLEKTEVFEERHLIAAIQNYVPLATAVPDSFFSNKRGHESIGTLYLEIEKSDAKGFTKDELQALRRELPNDLKDRIEHLMHPVFMPRNEEEVVRNVLSLSAQIKYLRDIPQVTISFDEQTHGNLFFTVILVRVVKEGDRSVQELFKTAKSPYTYLHERTKEVGSLRKKYLKEATIFRVKLPKDDFIRRDGSIDLYKARQTVFQELTRVVGDVRDYNGGMISKQNELLGNVRSLLKDHVKFNELLLENFFYSLTPVIMRTVLEPEALKTLFLMLLESLDGAAIFADGYSLSIKHDASFVYVMIKSGDRTLKEELGRLFTKMQLSNSELANAYVKVYDVPYMGYIYRCSDSHKQRNFCQIIQSLIRAWEHKKLSIH